MGIVSRIYFNGHDPVSVTFLSFLREPFLPNCRIQHLQSFWDWPWIGNTICFSAGKEYNSGPFGTYPLMHADDLTDEGLFDARADGVHANHSAKDSPL